jgi:hypothetical protein
MTVLASPPSSEAFFRRLTLPEEDRCSLPNPPRWNGSFRWFRSPNVVDLWLYRSSAEKTRIIDFAWSRWLHRHDGGPAWPP